MTSDEFQAMMIKRSSDNRNGKRKVLFQHNEWILYTFTDSRDETIKEEIYVYNLQEKNLWPMHECYEKIPNEIRTMFLLGYSEKAWWINNADRV